MTKLIIQIPCFNEEKTLPLTINNLPQKIEGIFTAIWVPSILGIGIYFKLMSAEARRK